MVLIKFFFFINHVNQKNVRDKDSGGEHSEFPEAAARGRGAERGVEGERGGRRAVHRDGVRADAAGAGARRGPAAAGARARARAGRARAGRAAQERGQRADEGGPAPRGARQVHARHRARPAQRRLLLQSRRRALQGRPRTATTNDY